MKITPFVSNLVALSGMTMLTSCLLPEINYIDRGSKSGIVAERDPSNQPAKLLSCVGIDSHRGSTGGYAGHQQNGYFGRGNVVVHFVVLEDGMVDPKSIEVRENSENIGRGPSALAPTREMILEAKNVARTCRYEPALRAGHPVKQPVKAVFVIARNT